MIRILLLLLLIKSSIASESDFVNGFCTPQYFNNPIKEAHPPKFTNLRVDCLTDEYAIEFDFAKKKYEALGQAIVYSALTGKKGGIVLIITKRRDYKYLHLLNYTIRKKRLPITLWIIDKGKLRLLITPYEY